MGAGRGVRGRRPVSGGQREAALQELNDRHVVELWRFAMQLTCEREQFDDVVQEVLLEARNDPGPGEARRGPGLAVHRVAQPDHRPVARPCHPAGSADRGAAGHRVGDTMSVVLDRWPIAEALGGAVGRAPGGDQRGVLWGAAPSPTSPRLGIPEEDREVAAGLRAAHAETNAAEKGVTRL